MQPEASSTHLTVIAVHGNGGGAFRFDLVPRPLAPGVELRAVTLPGFQGRRLPPGDISLATFTDALRGEFAAVDGPVVVLGHGIGGSIALDVVAHHPDAADALILLSPVGVKLDQRLFPKVMSAAPIRRAAKSIISSSLVQATAGRRLFPGAPRSFARRFLAEYANADAFEVMFDLLDAAWFDGLPPITVPVGLLWGGKDRVLNVSHLADYEAAIADTRRVVEPDWGHYPMIEQPDDFARVVARLARDLIE